MLTRLLLLGCVCIVYCSGTNPDDPFYSGLRVMYRAFSQCNESDVFTCFKMRTVKYMDRIQAPDELTLLGGITFQKIKSENDRKGDSGRDIMQDVQELDEKSLPEDVVARENMVDKILFERISRFFSTHTVKVNVPRLLVETVSTLGEGRGEGGGGLGGGKGGKKGNGIYIIGAMMAGGMKALALKSLALLAGKALLIAKMALVLAAVIAISKLTHHEEKTTYEVVHKGHGGYDRVGTYYPYGPYARSLKNAEDAHTLAYSAQSPETESSDNPTNDTTKTEQNH